MVDVSLMNSTIDELQEKFSKVIEPAVKALLLLVRTEKKTHSGYVLQFTELLKVGLDRAIKTKVDPLNGAAVKRILGKNRYSSPHDLYTKIEVANALGIIDAEVYRVLTNILKIRNEFAHARASLSLDAEPILTMFKALHTNPGITGTYVLVCAGYVSFVNDYLQIYLVSQGVTEDISPKFLLT